MTTIHRIRLRQPWEAELTSDAGPLIAADSLEPGSGDALPQRPWHGPLTLRRKFGRPTGIEDRDRVWLVIEGGFAGAAVTLNGQPLPPLAGLLQPWEADVTALLTHRCRVEISLAESAGASRMVDVLGPVRLEIRR